MPTNDFKAFAGAGGANVISQATYIALTSLINDGFIAGIAESNQVNKVWRQSSIMAAVLAQLIVDETGQDAVDDGTTATLLTNLKSAIGLVSNARATLLYEVASGTAGPSTTNGAFTIRELNTTQYDGIGLTLGSNQFTLPAGTYMLDGWTTFTPGGVAAKGKLNVYNATAATHVLQGSSLGATGTGYDGTWVARVFGVITVIAAQALELSLYANGVYSAPAASSGQNEVYSGVSITKIA